MKPAENQIRSSPTILVMATPMSISMYILCIHNTVEKPFVGLYLDSRSISYQKQKTKVKLWWVCTGIAGGYSASTWPEHSKNTKNVAILKSSSLWNENTSDTDRKNLLLLSTDSRRPCPLIFKLLSVFVW